VTTVGWLSPCSLLRRFAIGSGSAALAKSLRREVRNAVHSARNTAAVAVSSSRRSEQASAHTTRVAEDAIARVEQARAGLAND
jgi:hypothetical protein